MSVVHAYVVPRRRPDAVELETDGQVLVHAPGLPDAVALNPSARAVWELCDGTRNVSEVSAWLANELSCPRHVLLPDVEAAVAQLHKHGVLSLQDGGREPKVDWPRVAEPQPDQYDAQVALDHVARHSHGRWFFGGRPDERPLNGESCAEGAIQLCDCYRGELPDDVRDAQFDHPNIARAMEYLQLWPAAYTQFQRLMRKLHPVLIVDAPADDSAFLLGSRCHSEEGLIWFGTMWSSINCPLMLAENCVHEMGHQKLFALGVYKESSAGLVTNRPTETYTSPVITDRKRPMTAVLHGVFAYLHVTQLDLHVLDQADLGSPRRRELCARIQRNVGKLAQGLAEIRAHIRVDRKGESFVAGFSSWIERVIDSGRSAG